MMDVEAQKAIDDARATLAAAEANGQTIEPGPCGLCGAPSARGLRYIDGTHVRLCHNGSDADCYAQWQHGIRPRAEVTARHMVRVPPAVLHVLDLTPGRTMQFQYEEDGRVLLTPVAALKNNETMTMTVKQVLVPAAPVSSDEETVVESEDDNGE